MIISSSTAQQTPQISEKQLLRSITSPSCNAE